MKKLLTIVAVFVLPMLTGTATPAAADIERVSRTIGIDAGGTLTLKSFAGRITITGSDRTDVSIEGTRSGTREALDRHKLEIDGDRSHVRIVETSQGRSGRRDDRGDDRDQTVESEFTIQVPRRLNLDLDLFSSALEVREIEGNHSVKTFSSRARLENVNGSIRAKSFSGSFDLRPTNWREREAIDVETFSGRIDLRLPASARGSIDFESFSGRLESMVPIAVSTTSEKRMTGRIGSASGGDGTVRLKTFSGSVTVNH
jgi:DUF4097 and DUF4098 domain-containing protein YvlB